MKKIIVVFVLCFCRSLGIQAQTPVHGLIDRIDKGASSCFDIQKKDSSVSYFRLEQRGKKIGIVGNDYVSIATGLHWYLKYYLHIHLSWNQMKGKVKENIVPIVQPETHTTEEMMRYNFNYCTYSYSMAFWDWERWEQEIDWMALHGINLPLAIIGTDVVWKNILTQLGYSEKEINDFVAGPAFQAWWLMNNLEGWGGPNTSHWYKRQEKLQRQILSRMRELDMHPVLPGYQGMMPSNARQKLGLNVINPGKWCGYNRPSFLLPTDQNFQKIARLYYQEQERLFGKADYYSMDPFHEGGQSKDVDLQKAGHAIWAAMKTANKKAVWVIQAWNENPKKELMAGVPTNDLLVLDLFAESVPQWGDSHSKAYRPQGFDHHPWIFCLLLNFGGNVGLHGKMEHLVEEYYKAKSSPFGATMKGIGMTMEGIENNPVMYELFCELPWRSQKFSVKEWLADYVLYRYGTSNPSILEAWKLLYGSVYNCPAENIQQGTNESLFCARPGKGLKQVSSWSGSVDYYDPYQVIAAALLFAKPIAEMQNNKNYLYDLVDILRQALAEKGKLVYHDMEEALHQKNDKLFAEKSDYFLALLRMQDRLLSSTEDFNVDKWLRQARKIGKSKEEKEWLEWNARVQISCWGNRKAADEGGLHDYAHKEWGGILGDLYYKRWSKWINLQKKGLKGQEVTPIDYYQMEEAWAREKTKYPQGDDKKLILLVEEATKLLMKERI